MLKYIFLNISKTKKFYIPLFIVFVLVLYALMCSFAISENMIGAHEKLVGKYAAVAIFQDRWSPGTGINSGIIDEEFIDAYIIPEYTTDYYAFSESYLYSDALEPVIATHQDFLWPEEMRVPFMLMAYSDIEKSTHFRIGDRRIREGRFAENTDECNISAQLATLNGLSVGDELTIGDLERHAYGSRNFTFEIVGIYEDYTEEYSNELVLIHSKDTPSVYSEEEGVYISSSIRPSRNNFSRNQILTKAPTSRDLTAFSIFGLNLGYEVAVYYTHDEKSIMAYVDEIDSIMPKGFLILDSAQELRVVLDKLEQTRNIFTVFLTATILGSVVFCGLITAYILKNRTYDIGVFRTRGMSRIKTATLITGEVFIVSTLAFAAALALHIATFVGVADTLYMISRSSSEVSIMVYPWESFPLDNPMYNYGFSLPLTPLHFFVSFVVMMAFVAIIGFAIALLISRHEPMKTMTEH